MQIPGKIIFAEEKTRKAFYLLEKGNSKKKELFNAVNQALDALEKNAFSGIQIPKSIIPMPLIISTTIISRDQTAANKLIFIPRRSNVI